MHRSLFCGAALSAAILTLGAAAPVETQAQTQARQYDGYCYVRPDDMAADAATAPCLNGEYYAYTGEYRAAPRAPDGFQVEYFTRRPGRDVYQHVYNASTLTDNFQPGASNHFGAGDGAGYADNTGSGRSDYRADAPQDNQPRDNARQYSQSQYGQSQYSVSQYSPSDSGDAQPGSVNDDRAAGWRDDGGQWHLGQPVVGWRDESGRWHTGRLAAYGWQDDQGAWHENTQGAAHEGGY